MCAKRFYGSTTGCQNTFLDKKSLQPRKVYDQTQYDERLYEFIRARKVADSHNQRFIWILRVCRPLELDI